MSTLHHEDMLLDIFEEVQENFPYLDEEKQIEIANNRFQDYVTMNYDEILKCYNGVDDIHASTSFEFGLMNDLYYQLFYNYDYDNLKLFIELVVAMDQSLYRLVGNCNRIH